MVITISREYGSGGKYIGEQLSKKLGIKLYHKELLKKVAKDEKIDLSVLEANDEKQLNSFWTTTILMSYPSTATLDQLSSNEKAFLKTAKVIEKLARTEDCIIIGRCSNRILERNPNAINVFVYSKDMDFKVKRKMNLDNLSEKDTIKKIKKMDKERAAYYKYHTDGVWGDKKEYDLCIDTSKVGIDNTIALIETFYNLKKNNK